MILILGSLTSPQTTGRTKQESSGGLLSGIDWWWRHFQMGGGFLDVYKCYWIIGLVLISNDFTGDDHWSTRYTLWRRFLQMSSLFSHWISSQTTSVKVRGIIQGWTCFVLNSSLLLQILDRHMAPKHREGRQSLYFNPTWAWRWQVSDPWYWIISQLLILIF